jgi:hypothetical protein
MKVISIIIGFIIGVAGMFFLGSNPATAEWVKVAIELAKEIKWDTKDKAIVTPSGSIPSGHPFSFYIPQPSNDDWYSDNYIMFPVSADLYPNGITIERIGGVIDTARAVAVVELKYWMYDESKETFAAKNVYDLTFVKTIIANSGVINKPIPAGALVYLNLPNEPVLRWLNIWGYFRVNPPMAKPEVKK